MTETVWSGCRDLNPGPLAPQASEYQQLTDASSENTRVGPFRSSPDPARSGADLVVAREPKTIVQWQPEELTAADLAEAEADRRPRKKTAPAPSVEESDYSYLLVSGPHPPSVAVERLRVWLEANPRFRLLTCCYQPGKWRATLDNMVGGVDYDAFGSSLAEALTPALDQTEGS